MTKAFLNKGIGISSRRDDKISSERHCKFGDWKGSWPRMMKRVTTKKRRQRDRLVEDE